MCVCVCPVFSHGPQPVAIPVEKYQKSAAAATKEHKTHSHPHSTPKRTFKKPKHKKTLDFAQATAATFLTRRTVKDSARKKKKNVVVVVVFFSSSVGCFGGDDAWRQEFKRKCSSSSATKANDESSVCVGVSIMKTASML